jgi:hypothetical protein
LVAVRVRSEGEMAAPCGFSIGTEKLYDGQDRKDRDLHGP